MQLSGVETSGSKTKVIVSHKVVRLVQISYKAIESRERSAFNVVDSNWIEWGKRVRGRVGLCILYL